MSAQAAGLLAREGEHAARMAAPFVLITGGKGGVGKTTLAANLGVQLAREGLRVLLVDLDLGLANANVLLGLSPRRNLEDALAGRAPLAECIVRGPAGLHVLASGSGTRDMARPDAERRERLLGLLAGISASYDFVLGDSAAGIGPDVLAFGAAAAHVLVVTTPDPAALTDAYGFIKALDAESFACGREVPTPELVLNLASGLDEAESTAAKLRTVCEQFLARSPRLAGWLPRSPNVLAAGQLQRAFALESPGALENGCLRRLAARVRRLSRPARSAPPAGIPLKPSGGHDR